VSELLRAGDADREAVAEELRRAHEEGRLDTAELEERLERCYAAKTFAELDRLVQDLPRRPEARERRARPRPPIVVLPLVLGLVAVLAIATHGHVVLVWPLLFLVFVGLGRRRPRWR
jgi:Domain of unknown function (DUF1707)